MLLGFFKSLFSLTSSLIIECLAILPLVYSFEILSLLPGGIPLKNLTNSSYLFLLDWVKEKNTLTSSYVSTAIPKYSMTSLDESKYY